MRLISASGILCVVLFAASCQTRKSNAGSEVKEARHISSMNEDGKGTFTVICKNGPTEFKVPIEKIQRDEVCKGGTQGFSTTNAGDSGIVKVECDSGSKSEAPNGGGGDGCSERSHQVNARAFNAFLLWRDGKGTPILDYPAGYDKQEGAIAPDGVFYVPRSSYIAELPYGHGSVFTGTVTEGVKFIGDNLTYPVKEGRTLTLKFPIVTSNNTTHAGAMQFCKERGLRLPHAQELLDYCAAGKLRYDDGYPESRCHRGFWSISWWSASVSSGNLENAWVFFTQGGTITNGAKRKYSEARAICVGPGE